MKEAEDESGLLDDPIIFRDGCDSLNSSPHMRKMITAYRSGLVARVRFGAFLIVVTLLTCTAAGKEPRNPTGLQCSLPIDEMQVLTSYLKWAVEAQTVTVLVTTTDTADIDLDYANLLLASKGHGTPPEARQDLNRKSHRGCAINGVSEIRNLRLISKRDSDTMFRRRSGWADFHSRYGKDAHLVTLSRVGFDSNKKVALFYVTDGLGSMAGSCYLYVFELKTGKWVKKSETPVWST